MPYSCCRSFRRSCRPVYAQKALLSQVPILGIDGRVELWIVGGARGQLTIGDQQNAVPALQGLSFMSKNRRGCPRKVPKTCASERMCSSVRIVRLFRFFGFSARRRSELHTSAHKCKFAIFLCSCVPGRERSDLDDLGLRPAAADFRIGMGLQRFHVC